MVASVFSLLLNDARVADFENVFIKSPYHLSVLSQGSKSSIPKRQWSTEIVVYILVPRADILMASTTDREFTPTSSGAESFQISRRAVYGWLPITRTSKRNQKRFELSANQEFELLEDGIRWDS